MIKPSLQRYFFQVRNYILPQPKTVIFEHVPKCGGTSVTDYLRSQYIYSKVFRIDGKNPSKSINRFVSLPEDKRYSYGLVLGHGADRLRQYVNPNALCSTILRDPVDRIISHYYYVLRSPEHYLYDEVVAKKISLIDYATSSLSGELRNNYVTRFLQISAEEAESNPDQSVMGALNILQHEYSVVGTLDNLSLAMDLLASKASFNYKYKAKYLNVTTGRLKPNEVDQVTLDAISEINFLDVRLYELVKKHLAG